MLARNKSGSKALLKNVILEPKENALRIKKKVESRLDRIPDVRYPDKVERWWIGFWMQDIRVEWRRRGIPGVRHPGGMAAEKNSGCEISRWNGGGEEFRM